MGTPNLKVTGINHVVLHVNDIGRSVRFYKEVLGFEGTDINAGQKMSFLRCGPQGLDLFEVSDDTHGGEEMNHMALMVTAADLDEVEAGLADAGVTASERTPRNTVFIHDPDGHQIEVLPLSAMHRSAERLAAGAEA